MIGLTPDLALTASAIGELTAAVGRPPSPAELAWELDMTNNQLALRLAGLAERGWLAPHAGGKSHGSRHRLVLIHPAPPPPPECFVALTEAGRALVAHGVRRHG